MKNLVILFLFLCVAAQLAAQDRSNKGTEFWLGYGYNYDFDNEPPVNGQTLAIYISADQAATVTVSVNTTGWSQTVNIPANSVNFSITIPKSGPDDARIFTEGISTKGIHIVSDVPVVVYAHQYYTQLSGATMLMPVETYGYTYYSVNYSQTNSNVQDWYSWFFVVASENNTRLEITPSDTTQGGWIKGQTYTVNLNKGEIYNVFGKAVFDGINADASKDMTGSKVVSVSGTDGNCHPVAMFSGSSGIRICNGDGGEFMHQQMFPANAWGTRYVTYHTLNNSSTNLLTPNLNFYRVAVQDPSTIVKRNGVVLTGITNNFYYEFTSTSGDIVEADKPVLVAQYMTNINQCTGSNPSGYGDPEMFYLSPVEQGVKKALFYNARYSAIDYVYVNILIPAAGTASLLIDGAALPAANIIAHPIDAAYKVAVVRLTGAGTQHSISCDSTFTATVYGLGIFESYGYNVGCLVNNLNTFSSIKNTFNTSGNADTFTCPRTQVQLTIKTAYQLTSIDWKLSQAGGGINPIGDVAVASPLPIGTSIIHGRTYYTYTLATDITFSVTGTFFVPVTYTSPTIDNCNHTETVKVEVVVKPGPSVDFTTSSPLCLIDSVHFTDVSSSVGFNIVSHLWSFDDGSSINTVNAIKKFMLPGGEHVRYRIFADNGCTGDTTKTINIPAAPMARFGVSAFCSADSVRFTDTSSIASGTLVNWHYNFGDGQTATFTNSNAFTHHYAIAGTYTASLVVVSAGGCSSDTFSRTINILPSPLAKFGISNASSCINDAITFIDSSYIGQSIASWHWAFGDGNTSINTSPLPFTHQYIAAGNYTTTLQVISNNGCSSNKFTLPVLISSKPVISFTASIRPCMDSVQVFTSSIPANTGVPATWYWDFGDGQTFTSTTSNIATHIYTNQLTNVLVKHVVLAGCPADTATGTIPFINTNPVAGYSIVGDTLCAGKPLLFTAPANAVVTNYNWQFGDGAGNNTPPFYKTYNTAGAYTVTLKVSTVDGCGSLPLSTPIVIGVTPEIYAGPDIFLQSGNSSIINAAVSNAAQTTLLWSPATYLSSTNILKPVTAPLQDITYTVMAVNSISKCVAYDDVLVKVVTEIFVPNAFSPNGDGLNDTWRIPALQFYPNARVSIYNRYGQFIYHSTGSNTSWDGTYLGRPQPAGTYVYIIQPTDDPIQDIKGTLMIVR